MITYYSELTLQVRGLSTDEKPTEHVGNGSIFIEIETGKLYSFDREHCK